MELAATRKAFEQETNRSISMPLAGAVVWIVIGVAALWLSQRSAMFFMLFATGAIFPIALLIARFRNEAILTAQNPLSKLMGLCVLMVNLLWAVHLPLAFQAPAFLPLSLGIGLGLHWVVYSWIVQHPVGLIHAIMRTVLVLGAWYFAPDHSISAVSTAIVLSYLVSLTLMLRRQIT